VTVVGEKIGGNSTGLVVTFIGTTVGMTMIIGAVDCIMTGAGAMNGVTATGLIEFGAIVAGM
jgi:hypothetical protein